MKWDESYFRSRKHHVDNAVLVEISKTADFYLLICKKILILAFYVFYRLLRLSWEPGEKSNFFYNVSVKIIFYFKLASRWFYIGKRFELQNDPCRNRRISTFSQLASIFSATKFDYNEKLIL